MLEINLHGRKVEQYGRALLQKKHRQEGSKKKGRERKGRERMDSRHNKRFSYFIDQN